MNTHNPSTKKILFVTRPLTPPWDEASKNFAHDLAAKVSGHDITILTEKRITDVSSRVTQKSIYSSAHFSAWQKIRLVIWLAFNARHYDVIHLLFTPTLLNAKILRRLIPQNTHVIQTIATVREDLYKVSDYPTVFFGDTLVAYSKYGQKKLTDAGVKNVTHIYPGIDLERFKPEAKDKQLMKQWNIAPRDFVVSYPGEFARLGATDLIVDAFLEIWSDPANAHIKYLCACRLKNNADIAKKAEVRERIRKAGHLDKVIFTDTYRDVNKLYNLADLVIFPVVTMKGKFDVPLAMIEPYACKKVVVASDLELFREFSTDKINVIIPRNSSRDITDAVLSISHNSSTHVRSGELAYNFIHKNFDIETIAQSYKKLYDDITPRNN